MDSATVRRLIALGETASVEFKVAPPRPSDLASRLCGFANGAGGAIILGVADASLAIVGVRDSAASVDALLSACRRCRPPVRLEPSQPEVVDVEGKALVVGQVPANGGPLHQAGGVFYIRRGTHTVPMDAEEIEAHFHQRGTLAWEARPAALATLEDLDLEGIRAYLAHRPGRRGSDADAADPLTLRRIGCAAPDPGQPDLLRPTHAGLLLFGRAPQDVIRQAEVVCVLFGDTLGRQRYLDRRILHGTLPAQIDQAEEFVRHHRRVGARTEGFRRVDEPDYPLEALREAVVNAVVHRDYSLAGEAVRLFYYAVRIEIHSPGLLLPGVRLDDLQAGRVPSRPRNPILASLLRDIPGGYMERLGSGVAFMIQEMRALGRPAPTFREQGELMVTFAQAEQAAREEMAGPAPAAGASAGTLPTRGARQEAALRHVQEHGSITNKAYRALTGVSAMTAVRDLEMLVAQGALRMVGRGRSQRYTR